MAATKMKAGILGCGGLGGVYADACRRLPGVEIVACADEDFDRARELADGQRIPRALRPEQLLADHEVGLIINLTPPTVHGTTSAGILRAGKHVYSERPLAVRRRDAREIMGYARERALRIGCAPDTFLGAGLQTCRRLLDAGAIGEPISGAAFVFAQAAGEEADALSVKKSGGPLFERGPFCLTALVALLGQVRQVTAATRAITESRTVTRGPQEGSKVSVERPVHVAAVLEFDSGALVNLTASHEVAAHRLPHIELHGTEGAMILPDPSTFGGPVLVRRRDEAEWREIPLAFGYAGGQPGVGLADMAAAISEDREHRASARMAYHVLDIMHSILDSAKAGRHVEVASSMIRPEPLPDGFPGGMA